MRARNFVHFPLLAVHLEINNYAKATVVAPQDAKTILLPALLPSESLYCGVLNILREHPFLSFVLPLLSKQLIREVLK